jgi:hypothetical protein
MAAQGNKPNEVCELLGEADDDSQLYQSEASPQGKRSRKTKPSSSSKPPRF